MRNHRKHGLIVALVLGIVSVLVAISGAQAKLLVTSTDASSSDSPGAIRHYADTGASLGSFISGGPTLSEPAAIRFGPDGNIYVANASDDDTGYSVYRYNGTTGVFIGTFIAKLSNGLDEVKDMVFGPDGNLYIAANEVVGNPSSNGGEVMRFNGSTGAFIDHFIPNGAGDGGSNVVDEAVALAFGTDGNLYVATDGNNVIKFNGTTGAFMSVFVPSDSNGVGDITAMVFRTGNLYVANEATNGVLRFNGTTGAFIDQFVTSGSGGLDEPVGMAFGGDGRLYLSGGDSAAVFRYSESTGAFIDTFVASGSGGLSDPRGLVFFFTPEQAIPTLGQWSMILIAVTLLGMGGLLLRRRNRLQA